MHIMQKLSFFFITLTLSHGITHASEKKSEHCTDYGKRIKKYIGTDNPQEQYDNAIQLLTQGFNAPISDRDSAKKSHKLVLKGLLVRQGALLNGALIPKGKRPNPHEKDLFAHYMMQPAGNNIHATKTKTHNVDTCLQYQLLSPDDRMYTSGNVHEWYTPSIMWTHPEIAPFVPLFIKHGSKVSKSGSNGTPDLCYLLNYHAKNKTKTVEALLQDMRTAYTNEEAFLDDASTLSTETFGMYINPQLFSVSELAKVYIFIAQCDHHRRKNVSH